MGDIGSLFTNTEVVDNMTSMVQGEVFCDMEGAWWDVAQCQEEWAWIMPEAGLVLSQFVGGEGWSSNFCTEKIKVLFFYCQLFWFQGIEK